MKLPDAADELTRPDTHATGYQVIAFIRNSRTDKTNLVTEVRVMVLFKLVTAKEHSGGWNHPAS